MEQYQQYSPLLLYPIQSEDLTLVSNPLVNVSSYILLKYVFYEIYSIDEKEGTYRIYNW